MEKIIHFNRRLLFILLIIPIIRSSDGLDPLTPAYRQAGFPSPQRGED
ncbi:MAG: hypothetical protein QME83_15525 [Thermodesulfobacteriota bacterium]|nr:hypothetical protein [Thermodesulfobacteriota bacterium]